MSPREAGYGAAGYEITVAGTAGGPVPLDPREQNPGSAQGVAEAVVRRLG
ncbi:hypothetical protein [Streptomyces neyagawaensis]|nr:hypothetical protein [Streptomyces neyagawaensis]MCL6731576.1 hypothetical protein [Streptomyces neyagawaensis]MDE1683132.1 hypothetical protein [Streptomyces neyagawaensis]